MGAGEFQYEDACRIAGPLNPRWVISMLSRNVGPFAAAATSAETPARSQYAPRSLAFNSNGTSPGFVLQIFKPNCRARSYPNELAPIFGIESPPVAITNAGARNSAESVATENPSAWRTSRIRTLRNIFTPAARHSASSSPVIWFDERSQKSWPSVFS